MGIRVLFSHFQDELHILKNHIDFYDFKLFSLLHLDTKSGFAIPVLKAFIKDSSDLASVSFRCFFFRFFFLFFFFYFQDCLFALVPGQFYI